MGSVKEEASLQEEAVPTPEALRATNSPPTGMPGEASVPRAGSKKSAAGPPAIEKGGRWRECTASLRFVPWWALLASALVVLGIVGFALKGKQAGDTSSDVFAFAGSDDGTGFPQYLSIYTTAWPATLGVAGGVVVASLFVASVRTNQKLRRVGRTKTAGGFRPLTFSILHWLSIFLLVFVCLVVAWLVLNVVLLASWGLGIWAVREGALVASQSLVKLSEASLQYSAQLADLKGQVSGNMTQLLAKLDAYSPMLIPSGQAASDAVTMAQGAVCPSVACLNLGLYNFLESSACVCTEPLLSTLHGLAEDATTATTHSLIAVGCMLLGTWMVGMQLIAGINLMATDQLWLRLVRRRSSMAGPRSNTPPSDRLLTSSNYVGTDKKLLVGSASGAARRLPYGSPPQMYHLHSDARLPMADTRLTPRDRTSSRDPSMRLTTQ